MTDGALGRIQPDRSFSGGNQDVCDRDVRIPPNGIALDDCQADKPAFCVSSATDVQLRCIANGNRPNIAARSYHPGGVHAMLADGSIKFINDQIQIDTWTRLAVSPRWRAGGTILATVRIATRWRRDACSPKTF
jgi:hypothetical protein